MLEPVQMLAIRELLFVFKEDGNGTIYYKEEVSGVEKVKVAVTIKPGKSFTSQAGIELVSIPAGEFIMGCTEGDKLCKPHEKPAHQVKITSAL